MQSVQDDVEHAFEESHVERRERAEESFWVVAARIYRWRRFVIAVTGAVAVSAIVISLLLPNWYKGTARVLLPETSGGLSASLLNNLPSAASSLLGGSASGDYTRYLAILTSRRTMGAVVDSFDLVEVYDIEDSESPTADAIRALEDNVEFEIDDEYDFLSISAFDRDPVRAANLANYFVELLNNINMRLAAQSAADYRAYIEKRYREARADVDSLLQAREAFQREYGVFDLPAQMESFFEQAAELRAAAVEAEVQYEVLQGQYGSGNPRVESYRRLAESTNRKYQNALAGGEQILPITRDAAPAVARRYADLELEQRIQSAILEIVGPMYEQARMQEERDLQAVLVLDDAIIPDRKAKPKRSIIVIAATLSAMILAIMFVIVYEWWRRNQSMVGMRLRAGERGNELRFDE